MEEYFTTEHKSIIKRHRDNLVKFCHRFPKLYGFAYLLSFFSLIVLLAFADISIKAFTYPFYEMEETSGVIEERIETEVNVHVKNQRHSFMWYYYTIDGLDIQVNASQMRNYDEGDVMPYYRYERNGKVVGEIIKYTPLKGILIFMADALVIINAMFFMSTTTDKDRLAKRKNSESIKIQEKIDYNSLSASELYQLCLQRNVHMMHTKKKDVTYLKNCLRKKDVEEMHRYRPSPQKGSRGWSILLIVLVIVLLVAVMVSFAVTCRGILITLM